MVCIGKENFIDIQSKGYRSLVLPVYVFFFKIIIIFDALVRIKTKTINKRTVYFFTIINHKKKGFSCKKSSRLKVHSRVVNL